MPPRPTGMHVMRRSCFCAFQKIRCISRRLSSNICTGTFCVSLSRSLFRLLRLPSSWPSFTTRAQKKIGIQVKYLPQVFMQRAHKNRHPRHILSASCRHLETALPMEWHRLSAVPTRLSENCHPKLLVEQIVFLCLICHPLAQPSPGVGF